ncbi:hypothetical protein [uncultured Bacteroides sp.]
MGFIYSLYCCYRCSSRTVICCRKIVWIFPSSHFRKIIRKCSHNILP